MPSFTYIKNIQILWQSNNSWKKKKSTYFIYWLFSLMLKMNIFCPKLDFQLFLQHNKKIVLLFKSKFN